MATISGTVRRREAVLPLPIENQAGQPQSYEAVLDTGYTGYLALPYPMIRQLGLASQGERPLVLADGSSEMHAIYTASVIWHGDRRTIRVFEAGDKPLIGMRLLAGSRVTMDVVDGGPVTIETLAA